jgi:hypothetical protein
VCVIVVYIYHNYGLLYNSKHKQIGEEKEQCGFYMVIKLCS